MSESALERTARALDLVPYLLEHQGISISELAEVFGVSEEQINDDLKLIHMCGLPGYTPLELIDMYYEDGYVTVSEPQTLTAPRRMNRSEMAAILVGLDLLKSIRSEELDAEISALQLKLKDNIEVENPYVVLHEEIDNSYLSMIERAIAKSTPLRIEYLSANKDEKSLRDILPLEIYTQGSKTYILAWCQKSSGDRTFRLDRIIQCDVIPDGKITTNESYSIRTNQFEPIVLHVDIEARNFVEDNQSIISNVSKVDGQMVVTLSQIDEEWLIRTALGYGNQIKVLAPPRLAEEIFSRAHAIIEKYSSK